MGAFKVIGVGSPIVDLLAQVDDAFLATVRGAKGGMVMVESDELETLLRRLPTAPVRAPGGSAANTIFQLARLGGETALLGTVGADATGEYYRRALSAAGGSPHGFREHATAATARCLCLVTPDAERTMRPHLGAALTFDPSATTPDDFAGYELAHIEGYMLANDPVKLKKLFVHAKSAGCRLSLDLASFEVVQAFREPISELLDFIDLVFANADEADALLGKQPRDRQLAELAKRVPTAVLKLGENGAMAANGSETVTVPAEKVRAVDTTAAGDSFASGFIYGELHGFTLADRCRLGAAVAAEVVQVIGATIPEAGWQRIKKRAAEFAQS